MENVIIYQKVYQKTVLYNLPKLLDCRSTSSKAVNSTQENILFSTCQASIRFTDAVFVYFNIHNIQHYLSENINIRCYLQTRRLDSILIGIHLERGREEKTSIKAEIENKHLSWWCHCCLTRSSSGALCWACNTQNPKPPY